MNMKYESKVTLGQIIEIGLIIFAIVAGYFRLEAATAVNATAVATESASRTAQFDVLRESQIEHVIEFKEFKATANKEFVRKDVLELVLQQLREIKSEIQEIKRR